MIQVITIDIPKGSGIPELRLGNAANFNPSIVQLLDGNYLMSFHSFRRSNDESKTKWENHPWYGGPNSRTFWNSRYKEYQGTGFVILNQDFTIYEILPILMYDKLDMRLTMWNGQILATYNTFPSTRDTINLNLGKDRSNQGLPRVSDCCSVMYSEIIQLSPLLRSASSQSPSYEITVEDTQLICPNLASKYEKNWTPWVYRNKLHISYHLVPNHIVFEEDPNLEHCKAYSADPDEDGIFSQITEYYNRGVSFSLSTPAIRWGNEYLAVGHVKLYKESEIGQERTQELRHYKPHPVGYMRYFMFFYTFSPRTQKIHRVSNGLIPEESSTNVIFPTGLILNNMDEVVVSYGDGDDSMKCLLISPDQVNDLLIEDMQPEDFTFQII
jgi:hypothetical protein